MAKRHPDGDGVRLRVLAARVALGEARISADAARALASLGAVAVPALRGLIDPAVSKPLGRFLAVGALQHLAYASPEARRAIETAVSDPDPLVCDRALRALEAIGSRKVT